MSKAILYNKYRPLLLLEMDGAKALKVQEVINTKYLPIILENNVNVEAINKWIAKRILSDKRDGIKIVRNYYPTFERYRNMFSLSDQYWFQYSETEEWNDLNFFTNDYSTVIGNLFFTPWNYGTKDLTDHSPDLTTNGVLKKVWIREGDDSYLYKARSEIYHQEPLSEVLASITLERLNIIPFVKYELAVHGLQLCSKCKNFVTENTEFVPASYIYSKKKRPEGVAIYDHLITMCEENGIKGSKDFLDKMITANKIIGNDDCHLGNFGFLRDVETAQITGFAPLFDLGSTYWGKASTVKKARLFSEKEDEVLEDVLKKIDLGAVLNHEEMFRLVSMYPTASRKKIEEVKGRIINSERGLREIVSKNKNQDKKEPRKSQEKNVNLR